MSQLTKPPVASLTEVKVEKNVRGKKMPPTRSSEFVYVNSAFVGSVNNVNSVNERTTRAPAAPATPVTELVFVFNIPAFTQT